MLHWLSNSPTNQAIVVGGLVLLLLVVFLVVSRRRARARKKASAAMVIGALRRAGGQTEEVLELYRQSHPAFYRIVDEYRRHQRLDQLLSEPEFAAAFERLKSLESKTESRTPNKRVPTLQISAGERANVDKETHAAMLTVMRVLYVNHNSETVWTPQADADFDRLLESVTD